MVRRRSPVQARSWAPVFTYAGAVEKGSACQERLSIWLAASASAGIIRRIRIDGFIQIGSNSRNFADFAGLIRCIGRRVRRFSTVRCGLQRGRPVAQLGEHRSPKPAVAGSIPAWPANFLSEISPRPPAFSPVEGLGFQYSYFPLVQRFRSLCFVPMPRRVFSGLLFLCSEKSSRF